MTRPIPGGYLDRQLLARAMRDNTTARKIVGAILQERPGPERLALMLAQLAHHLADQADALKEMDAMRRREATIMHQAQIEQLKEQQKWLERQVAEMQQMIKALEAASQRSGEHEH